MSTAIEHKTSGGIEVWSDAKQIRKLFAPNLTEEEFQFFVGLGQALEANPFTREIWAVKYDAKAPASVFLGRDMYRRKAQEQPDYEGHFVDSVFEKDKFRMNPAVGAPEHEYGSGNRGQLVGAYALAYRKGMARPFYVFCRVAEYSTGRSLWANKPETMIKKVAEAQVLRMGWQGVFRGTYDEAEQWIKPVSVRDAAPAPTIEAPPEASGDLEQHIAALYAEIEADLEKPENVDAWVKERFKKCQNGFSDIDNQAKLDAVRAAWAEHCAGGGNVDG